MVIASKFSAPSLENNSKEVKPGSTAFPSGQWGSQATEATGFYKSERAKDGIGCPSPVLSPELSTIQALKRDFYEWELLPERDFSKLSSKPVRWVGLGKVRQLLNPIHPWFAEKQGQILNWEAYQCEKFPKPIFAYPRLSFLTPDNNPYKLSTKAAHSAMKSLRALKVVAESRKLDGVKVLDFTFTFPGELTDWLAGQHHGFTLDSEAMVWKLWRGFWRKDLEPFLLDGIDGKLGCHVNLHIWSTKKPGSPHWHIHVLALNQSYNNEGFTEIGHYLEGERLEELKRLWKARLLKFAKKHDIDVPGLKGKALPVVYFQYLDWMDLPRVIHKWQYVNRSPIEDYCLYANGNPGCADPPDWLVDYDNRARCYGWFREFSQIIGEVVYEDVKKDRSKACPLCGNKLAKIGTIGQADIEVMVEEGTPLFSLEWHKGKLCSVPLAKEDIVFLRFGKQ